MTVVVYEALDSMSGSISKSGESSVTREVRRRYLIGQCNGFNHVVSEIEPYAPAYVNSDGAGLFWRRMRLDVSAVGNKYFDVTATYSTLTPASDGGAGGGGSGGDAVPNSLAFDTTGVTERRYQAFSEEVFPDTADSFDSAIAVGESSVEGVDVVVPGMRYSESWVLPAQTVVSADFIGSVHRLTGTVNELQFRCFESGEALFLGARAQWQGDQPYATVTFEFECRPNGTFSVEGVEDFEKEGWEYVWIKYEDAVNGQTLMKRPKAAYKNTIYKKTDWQVLGIVGGTAPAPGANPTPLTGQAPQQAPPSSLP